MKGIIILEYLNKLMRLVNLNNLNFYTYLIISLLYSTNLFSIVIYKNTINCDTIPIASLKHFDQQRIDDFKNDSDFEYAKINDEPNWFDEFNNWISRLFEKFMNWLFDVDEISGFWLNIIQMLPYLILLAVLFLIVRLFINLNIRKFKAGNINLPTINTDLDEDIIKNQDIMKLLNEAIRNKNYRMAIRYYYLYVLKKLSNNAFIEWESQKTNADYIHEISENKLKTEFSEITRVYNFIWYGSFDVNENLFAKAKVKFESLLKSIQS